MFKRAGIAVAAVLLGACSGFGDLPFGDDAGTQSDAGPGSSPWERIQLSRTTAKPLEPVRVENLPESAPDGELWAKVYPGDDVEGIDGSFPGMITRARDGRVAPRSDGDLALVAPFLPSAEAADLEVVVTNGEKTSRRLDLKLQAIDVKEGAFENAASTMVKTVRRVVEKAEIDESGLRKRLSGEKELTKKWFPLAFAYHLSADPENPKSLANREWDDETLRVLDAFATRTDLEGLADEAYDQFGAPDQPMGGEVKGDDSFAGWEYGARDIDGPVELRAALERYHEIQSRLDGIEAAMTAASVGALVAGGILTGGQAPAAATAFASGFFSGLGIGLNVISYIELLQLGTLPCCLLNTRAKLVGQKGGIAKTPLGEDVSIPQAKIASVETEAWSQGMDFEMETIKTAIGILTEAAGAKAEISGKGVDAYAQKLVSEETTDFADSVVSPIATKVGSKLVEKSKKTSSTHFTWDILLHDDEQRNTAKWVDASPDPQDGGRSILTFQNVPKLNWKLDPEERNAFSGTPTQIEIRPEETQFEQPHEQKEYPAAKKPVKLRPIKVEFQENAKTVGRGEVVTFDVRVKDAEDRKLSEVEAPAGEVVEYTNWDAESKQKSFKYRAPDDKNAFPVRLEVESESDEGVRGEALSDQYPDPPPRDGFAYVYNDAHVSIPPGPCVATGESYDFQARVAPSDGQLVWTTSAGQLDVAGDTHSATFQAPDSPGTATIEVHHADNEDISDTATVSVRENCLCTYSATIRGHVEESDNDPPGGENQIVGFAGEKRGMVFASYARDETVAGIIGEDLPLSALREGRDSFRGAFVYGKGQAAIEAGTDSANIQVNWRGKESMWAEFTATGTAKVCTDCADPDKATRSRAPFRATIRAPIKRFEKEGTFKLMNCRGEIRDVERQPSSAPEPPDPTSNL